MIGKTIAHYTILEKIGSGGMGIVYRAEDTKLERTVALKFLPPELVRDETARERFIYEARAASALDHPNICTIHEINEADGHYFIAMAFVEGVSLKEKLARGPLPIAESIAIAADIASGLREAHGKGIVHRDIKPSNIMVTPRGRAKIMDFGLAKFPGRGQLTKTGTTLGTVAYMSPEQARGMEVDRRTDLWSLGVIFYEMLTGRQPFSGDYEQAVIYSILNVEAESIARHRTDVPTGLERIVGRLLDKNRDTRYQRAEELIGDIEKLDKTLAESSRPAGTASQKKHVVPYMILAACLVVILLFVVNTFRDRDKQAPLSDARQVTYSGKVDECVLSPDGNYIAYTVRTEDNKVGVWIKDLDSGSKIKIYSAWRCFNVTWSPDGSNLLLSIFTDFGEGNVYLLPRLGGTPRELIESPWNYTTWSPDGKRIAYIGVDDDMIKLLDIATGATDTVSIEGIDDPLHFCAWSPDGKHILGQTGTDTKWNLLTARIDGSDPHIIHEETHSVSRFVMHPTWAHDGKAIYYFVLVMRGRFVADLMKIAVDEKTAEALGEPKRILSSLHSGADPGIGSFYSISRDGKRFAYVHLISNKNLWLAKFEGEEGNFTIDERQLTTGTKWKSKGVISPDGSRIAFSMGDESSTNIYTMSLEEPDPEPRQLTFLNSMNITPAWSPDGETIAFYSDEGGVIRVWLVDVDGGTPAPVESSNCFPEDDALVWTPQGEILFRRNTLENLAFLDPQSGAIRPFLDESHEPAGYIFTPICSPDGMHIAFFWNRPKGGQQHYRVWILSVEDGSVRMLIDRMGVPFKWSADGKYVYCALVNPDDPDQRTLFKVPFAGGEPVKHIDLPFEFGAFGDALDMTMDGRTFVYQEVDEQSDVWIIDNFDPDVE